MNSASALLAAALAAYRPERRLRRPKIGLDRTRIDGRLIAVHERIVAERPFCRLLHFERETRRVDPRVLVVAPLSGHFAALMRDMLAALMPDHDLYLTDWTDAREIPADDGPFGIEENIGYILDYIRLLGDDIHLVGLCQSAMPVLAATSLLATEHDRMQPRTLTLIGGMIDTRIEPTRIARLVALRSLAWFERNAITTVPSDCRGSGRSVFPADMQHAAFVAYLFRHIASGGELLGKILDDDGEDAAHHPFLALYLSVMDLSAQFFLDTVRLVFHESALPRGRLSWRGTRVEPSAITRTALSTIEGERDDVSAPGQTRIAHDLCSNIPHRKRAHHLQPGVGHFGMFHGRVWRIDVMPRIRAFIRDMR